MSRIKIDIDLVNSKSRCLKQSLLESNDVKNKFSPLRYNIDPHILARRNISNKISSIHYRLNSLEINLRAMEACVHRSMARYSSIEDNLVILASSVGKIVANYENGNQINNSCDMDIHSRSQSSIEPSSATPLSEEAWLRYMIDILTNDKIGSAIDMLEEGLKTGLSAYYLLPHFKIEDGYLKVLNSDYYKSGNGLARWYKMDNIRANKYPNASKLYNVRNIVKLIEKAGKGVGFLQMGAAAFNEFNLNPDNSIERKLAHTAVEVGEIAVATKVGVMAGAYAGAKIGALAGTMIPIPVVGTAVGAVVGAAIGIGASYLVTKAFKGNFWSKGTKSTSDVVKDVVGDGFEAIGDYARGIGRWFGKITNKNPNTGAVPVT